MKNLIVYAKNKTFGSLSVLALFLAMTTVHAAILEEVCTESSGQPSQGDKVQHIGSEARVTFKGEIYNLTMTTQPNAQGIYPETEIFEDAAKDITLQITHTPIYQQNDGLQIGVTTTATVIQNGGSTALDSCHYQGGSPVGDPFGI
jgi:hypothetical protein